jgi:hypothetical protein
MIKEQIRELAEREYPFPSQMQAFLNPKAINYLDNDVILKINAFIKGGEAVVDALDIQDEKLLSILLQYELGVINIDGVRNQIINALKLKV